jgi:hypothetical protein
VTLILCPRNIASMRALWPSRFSLGLRLHNLSPDDGEKLVGYHPLVPSFEGLASFSVRDGAMLVAPASSKEAVTHHAVGKQKKEDCQDNYKQELSNPNRMDLRSSGSVVSKSVVIRAASVPARVLATVKLIRRSFERAAFSCRAWQAWWHL